VFLLFFAVVQLGMLVYQKMLVLNAAQSASAVYSATGDEQKAIDTAKANFSNNNVNVSCNNDGNTGSCEVEMKTGADIGIFKKSQMFDFKSKTTVIMTNGSSANNNSNN
jgi:hypothetical protein